MTPFPHSVDINAPVAEAREFMRKHAVRHLPVTKAGALAGIVTDRDIKLMLGPDFAYPDESELCVGDVYDDDAYSVDVSCPLDEVLLTMVERHIGSVLVTKHGKLAGIFTNVDACRSFGEYLGTLGLRTHNGKDKQAFQALRREAKARGW